MEKNKNSKLLEDSRRIFLHFQSRERILKQVRKRRDRKAKRLINLTVLVSITFIPKGQVKQSEKINPRLSGLRENISNMCN